MVGWYGGEGGVGVYCEVVVVGDVDVVVECGDDDVGFGVVEDIDGCDGFDFFKIFW